MGSSVLQVFLESFAAMFKVALICSIGIACSFYPSKYPIITPDIIKGLSRLMNMVLIPALILYALGSTVSIPLLARFGILILLSLIVMFISYSNVYAFKWLHEDDSNLFKAVLVSVGSPNSIGFPLLVMKSLCEDELVNADYNSSSDLCFQEVSSMMFVYSIGWHLVYWSYGVPMLKTLSQSEQSEESFSKRMVNNLILSPCMMAIYIAILIGIIPNFQDLLFKVPSVLRPFGSAITTLSEPVVCTNTLIMAASLAQVIIVLKRKYDTEKLSSENQITTITFSPINQSNKIEGVEDIFHYPSLPVEIDIPDQTENYSKLDIKPNTEFNIPRPRTILVMLICRLIIPPLLMLVVMEIFLAMGLVPRHERLMRLLVVIESSAPSAQLIIVSLNQIGNSQIASGIAYMYIFQYLGSIFTVTLWATIGLSLIYL